MANSTEAPVSTQNTKNRLLAREQEKLSILCRKLAYALFNRRQHLSRSEPTQPAPLTVSALVSADPTSGKQAVSHQRQSIAMSETVGKWKTGIGRECLTCFQAATMRIAGDATQEEFLALATAVRAISLHREERRQLSSKILEVT